MHVMPAYISSKAMAAILPADDLLQTRKRDCPDPNASVDWTGFMATHFHLCQQKSNGRETILATFLIIPPIRHRSLTSHVMMPYHACPVRR